MKFIIVVIWIVVPAVATLLMAYYLYRKILSGITFFFDNSVCRKRKVLAAAATLGLLLLPFIFFRGIWFIVLLHLTAFLLFIDGIVWLVHRVQKEKKSTHILQCLYRTGIVAIVMTVLVLSYGYYNMYHVIKTEYTIQTEKPIRESGYRFVLLSDLHYGISLNSEQLQKVAERITAEQPDAVFLCGDLVDESTTFTQMKEVFEILGKITSTYGSYYVFGNHDQNAYSAHPNYTGAELKETITASGITVLEDQAIALNDEIAVIGRADYSDMGSKRAAMKELVKDLDEGQEWIVLDHQPVDYDEVQKSGCDMILSGHTHAGQIWPVGLLASLFHFDEWNYGMKQQNNFYAIVTSGIAGWGFPLRTEKHSEYVILDLQSSR